MNLKCDVKLVKGVGKKSGKEYNCILVSIDTVDGRKQEYRVFPRGSEWRLMGIDVNNEKYFEEV